MSDTPPDEKDSAGEPSPQADSMAAFSNQLSNITDALDLLYIPYNASGRNKFRDKHPEIAQYIFGAQLIEYDNEGVKDRDHRVQLEEEADERRIGLKVTISEIVDKSVDSGSLQFEYVGEIIDKYGAAVSQFLYADNIIERVRPSLLAALEDKKLESKEEVEGAEPPPPPSSSTESTVIQEKQEDQQLSEEETTILSNAPDEVIEEKVIEEIPTVKVVYKDLFNSAAIGQ